MPNDSPLQKPGKETRLLKISETWAAETAKIAAYFVEVKNLLGHLMECCEHLQARSLETQSDLKLVQKDVMASMDALRADMEVKLVSIKATVEAHTVALKDMEKHCKKKQGIMAFLDWIYDRAKERPAALILTVVVLLSVAATFTILGLDLTKLLVP